MIHIAVASEINKRRKEPLKCFVQVNVSNDPNKSGIDESKVIAVKYGTKISDIIKNNIEITNEKYLVVENGLIAGKVLSELNNIVTKNTRSIFLNTKDTRKEKKCINCGLCMFKCPVGLNPKLIKDGKGDKSKCIHCGACTYVCPSLINFKKYLGDKDE